MRTFNETVFEQEFFYFQSVDAAHGLPDGIGSGLSQNAFSLIGGDETGMGAVCNDKVHFSAGGHVFIAGKGGEGKDEINYHAKKQEEFEQGFHVRRTGTFFLNSLSEQALAWYSLIFNYSLFIYTCAGERTTLLLIYIYAHARIHFLLRISLS